jgi:hypothetical protein
MPKVFAACSIPSGVLAQSLSIWPLPGAGTTFAPSPGLGSGVGFAGVGDALGDLAPFASAFLIRSVKGVGLPSSVTPGLSTGLFLVTVVFDIGTSLLFSGNAFGVTGLTLASLPERVRCNSTRFFVSARFFALFPLWRSKFGIEYPPFSLVNHPVDKSASPKPVQFAMRSSVESCVTTCVTVARLFVGPDPEPQEVPDHGLGRAVEGVRKRPYLGLVDRRGVELDPVAGHAISPSRWFGRRARRHARPGWRPPAASSAGSP